MPHNGCSGGARNGMPRGGGRFFEKTEKAVFLPSRHPKPEKPIPVIFPGWALF